MNVEILKKVLEGVAKRSGYSQSIEVAFKSKSGYKAWIHHFLYPFIYKDSPSDDTWSKNDFSMFSQVEMDPSFFEWDEIIFTYSDTLLLYVINLKAKDWYEVHISHYSGHRFCCWQDFYEGGL